MKKEKNTVIFKNAALAVIISSIFFIPLCVIAFFAGYLRESLTFTYLFLFLEVILSVCGIITQLAYFSLGKRYDIKIIKVIFWIILSFNILSLILVVLSFIIKNQIFSFILLGLIFLSGPAYIILGIGLLKLKKELGNIIQTLGIFYIIVGACICTILLILILPLIFIPFIIFEMIFFFRLANFSKKDKKFLAILVPIMCVLVTLLVFFSIRFFKYELKTYEENHKLQIQEAVLGIYSEHQNNCLEMNDNSFSSSDVACLQLINVTGFEKGKDELNRLYIIRRIYNHSGKLVDYSPINIGDEGKIFLPNNIMDGYYMNAFLEELMPGNYTLEIEIIDLVSYKKVKINNTIVVTNKSDDLIVNLRLGYSDNYVCKPAINNTFSSKDYLCFVSYIKRCTANSIGMYALDLDSKIMNELGKTEYYDVAVLSDYNKATFFPGIADSRANIPLSYFDAGNYVYEISIYDEVSGKKAVIRQNFSIRNQPAHPSAKGMLVDTLQEGETKTYTLDGEDYEIKLVKVVADSSTLRINGLLAKDLKVGDVFEVPNAEFGVWGLRDNDPITQQGMIQFYLSSSEVWSQQFIIPSEENLGINFTLSLGNEYEISVRDFIHDGEAKNYTVEGLRFKVTLEYIDEGQVIFSVNGIKSEKTVVGQRIFLSNVYDKKREVIIRTLPDSWVSYQHLR